VPIAACFDALRGQLYGMVGVIHAARVEWVVAPRLCTLAELIDATPVRPRMVVGDGAMKFSREVETWSGTTPMSLAQLRPPAASLLDLSGRLDASRLLDDATAAEPDYGRPAEAQARWEARHGHPLPDPSRASG
jgi:tRNA A37 threonylcarbamoyladenosine modification protein TsaB